MLWSEDVYIYIYELTYKEITSSLPKGGLYKEAERVRGVCIYRRGMGGGNNITHRKERDNKVDKGVVHTPLYTKSHRGALCVRIVYVYIYIAAARRVVGGVARPEAVVRGLVAANAGTVK